MSKIKELFSIVFGKQEDESKNSRSPIHYVLVLICFAIAIAEIVKMLM